MSSHNRSNSGISEMTTEDGSPALGGAIQHQSTGTTEAGSTLASTSNSVTSVVSASGNNGYETPLTRNTDIMITDDDGTTTGPDTPEPAFFGEGAARQLKYGARDAAQILKAALEENTDKALAVVDAHLDKHHNTADKMVESFDKAVGSFDKAVESFDKLAKSSVKSFDKLAGSFVDGVLACMVFFVAFFAAFTFVHVCPDMSYKNFFQFSAFLVAVALFDKMALDYLSRRMDEKAAKKAVAEAVEDKKKAEEKEAADKKKAEEKAVADKKKAEAKAAADKKKAEARKEEKHLAHQLEMEKLRYKEKCKVNEYERKKEQAKWFKGTRKAANSAKKGLKGALGLSKDRTGGSSV